MEAFQSALDALTRESKDLITHALQTLTSAVLSAGVTPTRVAVALAQRFTAERISGAFPVVCLVDGMLGQQKQAGGGEAAALDAVLKEFWAVAPPLFAHFAGQEQQVKDKAARVARRWRTRGLVEAALGDTLVKAIVEGATASSSAASTEGEGPDGNRSEQTQQGGGGEGSSGGGPSPSPSFTVGQVKMFRATLQGCATLLEKLPPQRARLYTDLIVQERFTGPSQVALTFLQGVLTELRRESGIGKTVSRDGAEQQKQQQQGSGGPAVDTEEEKNARNALGRLLSRLNASQGDEDAETSDVTHGVGTQPIRYTSPLFSDTFQRQSLSQRTGFGELRKRRHTVSTGPSGAQQQLYYPKKEANTTRPFRVPASMQASGGAVRRWFPTAQQWLSEKDMANLASFQARVDTQGDRNTSDVFSVARKREREGDPVAH